MLSSFLSALLSLFNKCRHIYNPSGGIIPCTRSMSSYIGTFISPIFKIFPNFWFRFWLLIYQFPFHLWLWYIDIAEQLNLNHQKKYIFKHNKVSLFYFQCCNGCKVQYSQQDLQYQWEWMTWDFLESLCLFHLTLKMRKTMQGCFYTIILILSFWSDGMAKFLAQEIWSLPRLCFGNSDWNPPKKHYRDNCQRSMQIRCKLS